jgi:hypothetical protein
MQDENAKLIAERIGRAMDAQHAALQEIRKGQEHLCALMEQRFLHLEKMTNDHEERIRRNTDAITRQSVATGGSGLISLVAILKAFIGSFSP